MTDDVYTSIEDAPADDPAKIPPDEGDELSEKMTKELEKE